jgi:hypothetical protein
MPLHVPDAGLTLLRCLQPKLTEPLLKKPPFRFLHDIVTEVKKSTGFPAELTDTDLDSGNFKDKESKVIIVDNTAYPGPPSHPHLFQSPHHHAAWRKAVAPGVRCLCVVASRIA